MTPVPGFRDLSAKSKFLAAAIDDQNRGFCGDLHSGISWVEGPAAHGKNFRNFLLDMIRLHRLQLKNMTTYKRLCITLAGIITIACLLSSCSVNQGNTAIKDFGKYANLEKNKTTKTQVYKSFGQPHNVEYVSSSSQWTYYNTQSSMSGATFIPFVGLIAGGTNNQIFAADFFFNAKGILENYSTNEKRNFTNSFVGTARGIGSHLKNTQAERVEAEMRNSGFPYDKKEARKARDMGTLGTDQS